MREGILRFNWKADCYEIMFDDGGVSMGLSCGEPFDINIGGTWIQTRFAFNWISEDWYLVGVDEDYWSEGQRVRNCPWEGDM